MGNQEYLLLIYSAFRIYKWLTLESKISIECWFAQAQLYVNHIWNLFFFGVTVQGYHWCFRSYLGYEILVHCVYNSLFIDANFCYGQLATQASGWKPTGLVYLSYICKTMHLASWFKCWCDLQVLKWNERKAIRNVLFLAVIFMVMASCGTRYCLYMGASALSCRHPTDTPKRV